MGCNNSSCIVTAEQECIQTKILEQNTDYGFLYNLAFDTGGRYYQVGAFHVGGFDCGLPLDPVLTNYTDDQEFTNYNQWINWQKSCGDQDYDIKDAPMACLTNEFWQGLAPEDRVGTMVSSWSMLSGAQRVYDNWKQLVDPNAANEDFTDDFDKLWPMLYQRTKVIDPTTNELVDNPLGKMQIDHFLITNPQYNTEAIKSVLYNNYTDEIQSYYGFMNASNDCSDYWRYLLDPTQVPNGPPLQPQPTFNACDEDANITNAIDYPKTTFEGTLQRLNWQTERGFHLLADPRTGIFRNPGFIGNPYWDDKTRKQAIMMAYGILPYNPADPGEGEGAGQDNPFATVPGYTGQLPLLGKAFNQGNPPVNTPVHHGAGDPTYEDPCDDEGPIQELLPWVTGAVGALVPFIVLPKEAISPYVLAATLGYSGYYIAVDSYGINAFERKIEGNEYYSNRAASALSLGLPAGLWLAGWDIGVFQEFDVPALAEWALLPPIALGADLFFQQDIVDALGQTTGILAIATFPIALLEKALVYLFGGCVKEVFDSPLDCKCSSAQNVEGGKTDIRNTLLEYYGVTGDQYNMRGKCMEMEMARGEWKSLDPNYPDEIGECDTSTGLMVNGTACWSAGRWTFGCPDYSKLGKRPDPADEMWGWDGPGQSNGGIWHCLDACNPSFLPPNYSSDADLNAKNKQCESQNGQGYRWIDKRTPFYYDSAYPNGICKNLALPGPNSIDGPGLQEPGQFK